MSTAIADGPPEAKKFRIEMPSETDIESSLSPPSDTSLPSIASSSLEGQPIAGEAVVEGQSPAAPSSARSSNGSVVSTADKEDESDMGMTGNLLEMISKSLLGNVFKTDESVPICVRSHSPSPAPPQNVVPGAVAVAQSPAARLFSHEDWSWHRNPAAAIRSGGTNKQTPVWKYFVYNKAENLSRCIIGDCTYMLKGPHTSTLACHLKKHPDEYAEFQKLKVDYTRERHGNQVPTSPSSSSSGCPPVPRPPKQRKEPRPDMNSIVNALRVTQSPPTNNMNLVQNLLGMNPLFMMSQQQVPTSTASLSAAQAATQMLQQAGLQVSATGQIMQSKKWRRDERRQRELESRLALALAGSHVNLEVLHSPLWRDFMEAAQPKFSFPDDVSALDQLIGSHFQRMNQSIKQQLTTAKRMSLVVEGLKFLCPSQEEPQTRLAISVTFFGYCGPKLETILLAFRPLSQAETVAESITLTVEQVLSDYDTSLDKMNRVICSGLQSLLGDENIKLFDNQMEAFSERLLCCFTNFLDTSAPVEELKKAVFALIFSFVTKAEALQYLNKATGNNVELPLTEPFPVLAEAVLKIKDAVQMICREGLVGGCELTDEQWCLLRAVAMAAQLFRQAAGGDVPTIDGVIPSIKQLLVTLEKESILLPIAGPLSDAVRANMAHILDVDNDNFDDTYAQATALNPQLTVLLNEEQTNHAKKSIEKKLADRLRVPNRVLGVDALLANVINQSKLNGNSFDFPLHADIFQQANERINQSQNASGKERMAEALVGSYFDEVHSGNSVEALLFPFGNKSFGNPFQPPLQFWQQAGSHSPQLADMASELLSIAASPSSISRLLTFKPRESPFHSIDISLLISHIDKPERLERDLLLRANRHLLPKSY